MTPKDRDELHKWLTTFVAEHCDDLAWHQAAKLLAGLDKAGIALVPKEPTKEMLEEVRRSYSTNNRIAESRRRYDEMLAASPYRSTP